MNQTTSEISVDLSAIGRKSIRERIEFTLETITDVPVIKEDFWGVFLNHPQQVPKNVIVIADLARLARPYLRANEHNWIASVRRSLPVFVVLVRTKYDVIYTGLIDDIFKHSDARLWVCDRMKRSTIRECLSEAVELTDPRTIIDIHYQFPSRELLVEFGDGVSGSFSLQKLGLKNSIQDLVLETALIGEGGYSLQLLRETGDVFDIDSDSLRTLFDSEHRRRLETERSRSVAKLGDLLRDARKSARMTQTMLGQRTGIDQALISKMERGRHRPRIDTLRRIAAGLNTNVASLLSGFSSQP